MWFVLQPAAIYGQGSGLPGIPAVWQLVTYPFFLFAPLSLLFAILLYGWFAGTMEAWWGAKRFLRFFFIVSIGSALLAVAVAPFWPALAAAYVPGPYPVIEGLVIAWGLTFPNRTIYLFFILPVKGMLMVWLTVGIVALYIIFSGEIAPFMPQIFGMAIAAVIVTGVWRPRKLTLRMKKWRIERELQKSKRDRKRRVEGQDRLHVVDKDDEDDDEGKPPRGNGAPDGGWLN